MDSNTLWSLRLGFSGKQASAIKQLGIERFLESSFSCSPDRQVPGFIANGPKTTEELKVLHQQATDPESIKLMRERQDRVNTAMKAWWIDNMIHGQFPLREKMTLFWHNHFVAPFKSARVNYWTYTHYDTLYQNAFGNFRHITKQALYTNSIVRYLDNFRNIKGKYNENLSRELLELFTIGIGNYSEQDIKNGAKGLAGLTMGDHKAVYITARENTDPFEYFGNKGNFKAQEMVDIIFGQGNAPYHITRKLLRWFIYDNPPEKLVRYYGDYLRKNDFELQPLLTKIITEEFSKPTAGSKIKDPLLYILQLADELHVNNLSTESVIDFIRSQGMDPYSQTSVKGWEGGTYWLTTQTYLRRHKVADQLCNGKTINPVKNPEDVTIRLDWNRNGNNKDIIRDLTGRLLFRTDEMMQADLETLLKYDFDPKEEGAENGVIRLFNHIIKTPEFQLI
jgi:uncharacterized protein (DUF1800 family)